MAIQNARSNTSGTTPSSLAQGQIALNQADGTLFTRTGPGEVRSTPLMPVVGDTGSGGKAGYVPAPAAGDAAANKYFKADGTWSAPPSSSLPSNPTFTGPVTAPEFDIDGASGTERPLIFKTTGSPRWRISANTAAESSTSNGSNLSIGWYNNSGAFVGNAVTFLRNGTISVSSSATFLDGVNFSNGIGVSNGASFSGTVTVPTQTAGNSSTRAASTAFVAGEIAAAAAAAPGYVLRGTLTPTGATADFVSIADDDVLLVYNGISGAAAAALNLSYSTDNGTSWTSLGAVSVGVSPAAASAYSGTVGVQGLRLGNILAFARFQISSPGVQAFAAASATGSAQSGAQINGLRLSWGSGNFDAGTISLYGKR